MVLGNGLLVLFLCIFKTACALNASDHRGHEDYAQFLLANGVARTPPMGWNSWNHFQCGIDEWTVKSTADALVSTGLAALGFKYVNIDDCWAERNRDQMGNLRAKSSTFPSGIKALASYVHAKGLKLGIYSDAGYSTCSKTMPGSLGHEDQDARTFAAWGVDYLKYDNCYHDGSQPQQRFLRMSYALQRAKRPILYSICEWYTGFNTRWERRIRQNGLVSLATLGERRDIKDRWDSVTSIADINNIWGRFAGPGRWNDPDMLEVGNGGMTLEEYRSHFSIWAVMKAPLLIGCDIRSASRETLAILRNKEVIDVNQDPLGVQARKLRSKAGLEVWAGPLSRRRLVIVLWNRSRVGAPIMVGWREIGLSPSQAVLVRDVWKHSFVSKSMRFHLTALVAPHACKMVWPPKLRSCTHFVEINLEDDDKEDAVIDGPMGGSNGWLSSYCDALNKLIEAVSILAHLILSLTVSSFNIQAGIFLGSYLS
ncbi:hypothetical protein BT93_D0440 [Corymbia citriodora subsp. variegata]|nr:hypothetical protein BT93_D0440 [Corymbia citriodora subsp. variegata]